MTEKITGLVVKVWGKETTTGKQMYNVRMDDQQVYGDFGSPPEWLTQGANAEIEFERKGEYRNIKTLRQVQKPSQQTMAAAPAPNSFKNGNQLTPADAAVKEVAGHWAMCREAFKEITGEYPKTEATMAAVNTIFIELCRRRRDG